MADRLETFIVEELAKQSESPRRSATGEIWTGGKRGALVHLPGMIGQGMKWIAKPGTPAYEYGESLRTEAEIRGRRPDLQRQPEAHGAVTNSLAGGAEMLVPSVAPQALAVAADVLFPPGAPVFHGMAAAASGGLFGASQAQDTYERVLEATGDDAKARRAGWSAGVVEAGGEALSSYIGGKYLTGALRMMGPQKTSQAVKEVLRQARNPQALKSFGKATLANLASEVSTEMGQNAGAVAVERAAGVTDGPTPGEAAMEAISPTVGLSALMLPFGALGTFRASRQNRQMLAALEDPAAPVQVRTRAATYFHDEIAQRDKKAADQWAAETLVAIGEGRPLKVTDDSGSASSAQAMPSPSGPLSKAVNKSADGSDEALMADDGAPWAGDWNDQFESGMERLVGDENYLQEDTDGLPELQQEIGGPAQEMPAMRSAAVVADPQPLEADAAGVDARAHEAATSPANATPLPTEPQIKAGNYKKGHVSLHGMDISIENPLGSTRSGTDPSGKPWSVTMPAHYGYLRKTEGADGDHVDVYVGGRPESDRVFVVDQVDAQTGTFDEHKVILGAGDRTAATDLYLNGFSDSLGERRLGAMTEMGLDEFKDWLKNGDTKRPLDGKVPMSDKAAPIPRPNFFVLQRQARQGGLKISKKQQDGSYVLSGLGDGAEKFRAENLLGVYDFLQGNEPGTTPAPAPRAEKPAEPAPEIVSRLNLKSTGGKRGGAPVYVARRIDPSIHRTLSAMRSEIAGGEAAGKIFVQNHGATGGTATVMGTPITFPDYFRDKGFKKQTALIAIDRYLEGKGITGGKGGNLGGQVAMLADLVEAKRKMDADLVRDARRKQIEARHREADLFAVDESAKAEVLDWAKEMYAHLTDEEAARMLRNDMFALLPEEATQTLEEEYADTERTDRATESHAEKGSGGGPSGIGESSAQEEGQVLVERTESGDQVKLFPTPPTFGKKPQHGTAVEKLDFELAKPEPELFDGEASRATAARAAGPRSEPVRPAEPKPSKGDAPATKIEDFGEVLEGARKHYATAYGDKLRDALEADPATVPLSKSWPEPDYARLLAEGADPWTTAFIRALRDEIPNKPQKGWKLRPWVELVRDLRQHANGLLEGRLTRQQVEKALVGADKKRLRESLADRADLYEAVGHDKNLADIRVAAGQYGVFEGQEFHPPKTIWTVERKAKASALSNWPQILGQGDTREAALADFKKRLGDGTLDPKAEKGTQFSIYSDRATQEIYIGKKLGRAVVRLKEFDTVKQARDYLADNRAELEALLEKFKELPSERRESNAPRVGVDHRDGADVSPEQFQEAFSFRGVQFGNYMENDRRQQDLNETYDALMDLAGILELPPKALSLNGELGLAFGARGTGGKNAPKAHYEPGTVVINLTKKQGAGSLAHELWHGIDNYFSRLRGDREGYLSEKPHEQGEGVRPEMVRAFNRIKMAVGTTGMRQRAGILDAARTKEYWSTGREMSARAFESYVVAKLQDQSAANDYLANIVSEQYWEAAAAMGLEKEGSYPYPVESEMPGIRAAFESFFRTVETRETPTGIAMFSMVARPSAQEQSRRFAEQVDRFTAKALQKGQPLVVGHTPDVLRALGAADLPVVMTQRALAKITSDKHRVPTDLVKSLPQALADPVMVFDSATAGGLIVLTDRKIGASSVVAAVHLSVEEQRHRVNRVASLYGKDRASAWISEQIEAGRLRYVKNEKALAEHVTGGLQSPKVSGALQGLSSKKILSEKDVVKTARRRLAGSDVRIPLSDKEFDAVFKRVTARLENPDAVVVVPTAVDLPAGILAEVKKQGNRPEQIDGVFHDGKVYIVRRHMTSSKVLEEVLFHELHGHAGLFAMMGRDGDALKREMANLYNMFTPAQLLALAKKYRINLASYAKGLRSAGYDADTKHAILMEEMLAHLTREYSRGGIAVKVREILGRIREWLRKNGFIELATLTESDLAYLLSRARAHAEAGAWAKKGDPVVFNGQEILQRLRERGITEDMLTRLLAATQDAEEMLEPGGAEQMPIEMRFALRDLARAQTTFFEKLAPHNVIKLFRTLPDMFPESVKDGIGEWLSNPHYGSKKSKWRGETYELSLDRAANASEIKWEVMATRDGYDGLEVVRKLYYREASKDERAMVDKLLVEGDINKTEYSVEDLSGNQNPLGRKVSLVVQNAYFAFRQTIAKATEVMFDRLGRLRLIPYEGAPFYQELVDLLDQGLNGKQVARKFGIHQKAVDAYIKIQQGRKKLDAVTEPYRNQAWYNTLRDAIVKGLSGVQMQAEFGKTKELVQAYYAIQKRGPVLIVTAERYQKAAWYRTLVDLLTVGDDHPMLQKVELYNAYLGVQDYDSELARLKNEWRQWKGYLPRIRKDGEQHVKAFRILEDGTYREVWMQPAKTVNGANKLKQKVEANLQEYFPHNFDPAASYMVVVEPNTATPEEIFQGIGSHRAIEALLSKVFDRATDAGVIENQLEVQRQVLRILADEISARGFGRHRIGRSKDLVEGYETDNTPALLAQYVGGMAGWLAKSEFAMRANRLMSQIPSNQPGDKKWVRQYVDDALKNAGYIDQWLGTARSAAALLYLGFKTSSAILNATQNYIWGQAKLSVHTKGATRKLLKAQHDVIKDMLLRRAGQEGILTAEELWVLEQGSRRGRSQAALVRAMTGLDDTGGVMGRFQSGIRWLTEKSMIPFQAVETHWNREPALLAAYRVFKEQGMTAEQALKKAEGFVDDVHFVVGKENLPAVLRKLGPLGRTLYTFQSYTHNYLLGLLTSLQKGEFEVVARSLAALALFGGMAALPFGDDLDKWYRRIFGERPLRMLDRWLRETAGHYTDFGDQIADFVMHGAPALAGVNFSRAIGVNIPWFSAEDESLAERVTGVWGGMAQKVRYAGQAASKADFWRAAEYMTPEALANILRAYRHYADGATTLSGRPVFGDDGKQVRYTAKEAVIRAFGFMPLEPSKQSTARWDARLARDYWQERKSDVLARYRTAEDRKKALKMIRDFNRELRAAPGGVLVPPINRQTLRQALRSRPDRREMAYRRPPSSQ